MNANEKLKVRVINHLALVCKDMKKTAEFYSGLLGMPLTKTIELPNNLGQHFFFDCGGGDQLAFFWFPDAPESQPGVTHSAKTVGEGPLTSAHASMNHVAYDVAPDMIDEYQKRLEVAGVKCTAVYNHDDSAAQASLEFNETTFVRSVYFKEPDGNLLDIAS